MSSDFPAIRLPSRPIRFFRRIAFGSAQMVVLACICLLVLVTGQPVVALAAAIVTAGIWAVAVLPLDRLIPAILFLTLFIENPAEQPFSGLFSTPISDSGDLWYATLAAQVGIPIPLSPMVAAILIVGFRALVGATGAEGRPLRHPDGRVVAPPVPFRKAALISFLAVLATWFFGLVTGGSFPQSQFQVIAPLMFPVLALAASAATTDRLVERVEKVILGVAVYRALLCVYVWWTVVRAEDPPPEYVTIHSDAVLWPVAILIVIARLVSDPTRERVKRAMWMLPLLAAATAFNERRLAYVAILAGLVWIFFRSSPEAKFRAKRVGVLVSPFALLYMAAGWNSSASVFSAAQSLKSVFFQDDSSSDSRDLENLNLIFTFIQNPWRGSGFGREYLQLVPSVDLSENFELFLYVPHNSILAMWAFAGLVGFIGIWLVNIVGITHLVAAHRRATTRRGRELGLWTGCALIAYVVQGWGDIGLQAWMPVFIASIALGIGASAGGLEADDDDLLSVHRSARPSLPVREERSRPAPTGPNPNATPVSPHGAHPDRRDRPSQPERPDPDRPDRPGPAPSSV